MRALSKSSTILFLKIIDKLGNQSYIKIQNDPYMALSVERLQDSIRTKVGLGTLYSLSHNYEKNGDLMRDPEMVFILVDNRSKKDKDLLLVKIMPIMYQQDSLGIYQESILKKDNAIDSYKPNLQAEHTIFANMWMNNIRSQGFLNI